MTVHNHPVIKSVRYAISGISEALREEPNLRIHTIFAMLALLFGVLLKISEGEWLVLILVITFVIILELLNTSLEAITDLASPSIHPKAKLSKDVAAGAVLVAAVMAVAIGAIIFLPKILTLVGIL